MNSNPHSSFIVNNVRIFFPFEPYETQRQYMTSVVEALTKRQHALLESPTGTGKTLSLLCSTLAWLQSQGSVKTIVYYTSRTHMQLAQAAKEMKRTAYARNPAVVIGSRAQMCLNDDVRHQAGDHLINRACRNAITKNACSFYSNYEQKMEVLDVESVNDIEDLCSFGRNHMCCPYYASKKLAESKATVVFMPYNYLLDTSLRKSTQLKLENSVIIFDEAHNIESVLKDCVSGNFTQSCLSIIQESCLRLPEKISEALNQEKHGLTRYGYDPKPKRNDVVDEFAKKKDKPDQEAKVNPIEELAAKLTNDKLQQVNRCAEVLKSETLQIVDADKSHPIEKVFELLKQAGIQYTTSDVIITTLESMASFWSIAGVMNPATVAKYVTASTNLSHVVSLLFPGECLSLSRQSSHEKRLSEFYTAHLKGIYGDSSVLRKGELKDWELNVWCLHPAVGLKRVIDSNCINGPRSLIVTSGTLAPMLSIEKELELEFKVIREFKHIIDDKQLKIMVIGKAPNSYSLASHYEATKKDEYPMALGKTLLPLFRVLPYGTLIFFQSYFLLDRVVKFWKEKCTIWRDMTSATTVFIESKKQGVFLSDVAAYKRKLNSTSRGTRAVFFGVCRGKLSEGVNLDGNQCRTVILTGLPFPSLHDPKVTATKEFHGKRGDQEGRIWYSQQMKRALNQTIGRVIRNREDFGLLLLCDPRFTGYKFSLSEWVRKYFPNDTTSIGSVESEIKQFFQVHGISITESVAENVGAFELGLSVSNMSPFSAASSQTSNKSNENVSHQDKQNAMIRSYSVSREEYKRLKERQQTESVQAKRPRTTTDAFDSLFSHPEPDTHDPPQLVEPPNSNQTGDVQFSTPSTESQPAPTSRPAKSLNIFKKRISNKVAKNSQPSSSSQNYSILKQYEDKNRPAPYKCYICLNLAEKTRRTNCPCARVGCLNCLRVLNKKKCAKCGTILIWKEFKPLRFDSACLSRDRQNIVIAPSASATSEEQNN